MIDESIRVTDHIKMKYARTSEQIGAASRLGGEFGALRHRQRPLCLGRLALRGAEARVRVAYHAVYDQRTVVQLRAAD